jgi:hypothetical protein
MTTIVGYIQVYAVNFSFLSWMIYINMGRWDGTLRWNELLLISVHKQVFSELLLNLCPFLVQTMQPFIGRRGEAEVLALEKELQNYLCQPLGVYQPIETRRWGGGVFV